MFHDNCVVNFSPPDDDGGTDIVKYVVEEMNMNEGGGWTEVAECGPNEKKAKIDGLKTGDQYRYWQKKTSMVYLKLINFSDFELKLSTSLVKVPPVK